MNRVLALAGLLLLASASPVPAEDSPRPGERLEFLVDLGPIHEAARASVEVFPPAAGGPGDLRLRGEAEAGPLLALIYPFHYVLLSTARVARMMPMHSSRQMDENGASLFQTLRFDHRTGSVRVTGPTGDPGGFTMPIRRDTRDLMTALFHARYLRDGSTTFSVFENRLYEVHLRRVANEEIQVPAGRFPAVRYAVSADGGEEEPPAREIRLWLSADARRLPLRLEAGTLLGPLVAELQSWHEPPAPAGE
ncbi:MAG: DUF3108 domain-containing protein [Acidobacteriota bacterium]|jgi:hypothetical protein